LQNKQLPLTATGTVLLLASILQHCNGATGTVLLASVFAMTVTSD
jgi:hypothetical protein